MIYSLITETEIGEASRRIKVRYNCYFGSSGESIHIWARHPIHGVLLWDAVVHIIDKQIVWINVDPLKNFPEEMSYEKFPAHFRSNCERFWNMRAFW